MPYQTLLKALEDDARGQCEKIVSEAEEQAERAVREAEEEARRARSERFAALEGKLARERASRINDARTRAGALKLSVRRRLIERVLDGAFERVRSLPEDEYVEVLRRLAREAAAEFDSTGLKPVISVNPADAGRLDGALGDGAEVRPDPEVTLGVVASTPDGRRRVENTVASRIERARDHLLPMLDKLLFSP